MPNISVIKDSKYLTKNDCGTGILVTVGECTQENLAQAGQPEENKWILHFAEPECKPMVLNSTNAQIIAQILGSEQTEDWQGSKIVLYEDKTIQFQGRLVGGIRVRAPRNQAAARPALKTAGTPTPKPRPAPARPAPEPEPPLAEPDFNPDDPDSSVPF